MRCASSPNPPPLLGLLHGIHGRLAAGRLFIGLSACLVDCVLLSLPERLRLLSILGFDLAAKHSPLLPGVLAHEGLELPLGFRLFVRRMLLVEPRQHLHPLGQ